MSSAGETQVAIAMLFKHSTKTIARELQVSPRAVRRYRERLYRRYGVRCARDLVRILMSGAGA
jgi:FixJ family two-component response regulator